MIVPTFLSVVLFVGFCSSVRGVDHAPCCWNFPGTSSFRMVGGKVDPITGTPVSVEVRSCLKCKLVVRYYDLEQAVK